MIAKGFKFSRPAELYEGRAWKGRPTAITYRRFDTAAEAVRYAVEELPGACRRACVMEVDEKRFNSMDIRKLYESIEYPFQRQTGKDVDAS